MALRMHVWHDCSATHSQGKGERMTEDGILGIIKCGNICQVRYASYNPHGHGPTGVSMPR